MTRVCPGFSGRMSKREKILVLKDYVRRNLMTGYLAKYAIYHRVSSFYTLRVARSAELIANISLSQFWKSVSDQLDRSSCIGRGGESNQNASPINLLSEYKTH